MLKGKGIKLVITNRYYKKDFDSGLNSLSDERIRETIDRVEELKEERTIEINFQGKEIASFLISEFLKKLTREELLKELDKRTRIIKT